MRSRSSLLVATGALAAAGCAGFSIPRASGGGAGLLPAGASLSAADSGAAAATDLYPTTEQVARDLATIPDLTAREKAARVILDAETLSGDVEARVHRGLLAERLRVHLNRAARGRLLFVPRGGPSPYAKAATDPSAKANPTAAPAADFRLDGYVVTQQAIQGDTGTTARSYRITFTLVDLKNGHGMWTGTYDLP